MPVPHRAGGKAKYKLRRDEDGPYIRRLALLLLL
jgi:hypothetical protein